MSFHNKKFNFDDDDDDLESLRLAALKSLATKKETTSPLNGGNAIEVLDNGPISRNISTVRPINTLDNANLHVRLDVTEPYVPQSVPNVARVDWNYNAAYIGNMHAKPIVIPTLSPRSLAFVEQNNDILLRRKGEKSTRSPSPYREDFMRWSESPPPFNKRRSSSFRKSHSRTVSRSPVLNTRFSKSPPPTVKSPRRTAKSPVRNTRPFKKRSKSRSGRSSRSPVRRGDSQNRIHSERRRSTSLYPSSHQNKFSGRNLTIKQNDRLASPPMRHRRSSRSQSPVHLRNKSLTPPSQLARTNRKRSRSPYQPSHHLKRSRSISRSPHRKARPRSREFGTSGGGGGYSKGGNNNKHYANKNIEFNRKYLSQNNYSNRNNNKYHNNNNKYSNKYDTRREPPRSPAKYRSKSKSPVAHHHSENGSKTDTKKIISTSINSNKIESSSTSKEIVPHNVLEHDKLSSTDDDDQNSTEDDENNDEDGIDLFASEESESENEGRFKSSSKNTDNKKIATLSYSKLSETAAVCVSELKDMNANPNWNEREYSRRNNGDRDRDRDRKSRRGGDRDDNWKSSRRNRTKDDESVSRNNKKTEKSTNSNSGSGNGMKMFRSTFQAVDDSDLNTKKESSSKSNEDKSISKNSIEGNSETRSVLHLKRSLIQTKGVDKDGTPVEESMKVHETSVSSESIGKKPIHLRLGAISNSSSKIGSGGGSGSGGSSGSQNQSGKSNTSWKSKKSWRTEKVSINIYL